MRIGSTLMSVLFALGAAVQWNDPDPLLWIAAYLVGMGLSVLGALGRPHGLASLLAALVLGVSFLVISPSLLGAPEEAFTSVKMQAVDHEEPREAVGLALLSGWSFALAYWAAGRARASRDVGDTGAQDA